MRYELSRERRKSLKLTIEDGVVVVKAPWFVPERIVEEFVASKRDWIQRRLEWWRQQRRFYYLLGRRHERGEEDVERLWMETMERVVIPRAWELAERFGERPSRIRISRAKKRWGSCSSKGSINLSYRLAQLPMELIDYVIVHELCHLRHMDHSPRFWALVAKRCPDFRQLQRRLSRYG